MKTEHESPLEILLDDGRFRIYREAGIKSEATIRMVWTGPRGAMPLVQIFTADHREPGFESVALRSGPKGVEVIAQHRKVLDVIHEVWKRRHELGFAQARRIKDILMKKR